MYIGIIIPDSVDKQEPNIYNHKKNGSFVPGGEKMDLQYIYNEDTGVLHIKGIKSFCYHAKATLAHCKIFSSEKEAYDYAGQQIKPCKTCQQKKEQMLKEGMR